jgi:hypothetical protein
MGISFDGLTERWYCWPLKQRGGMDTSKLVVGEDVYMYPGHSAYGYWKGRVVKSTSTGVEVQLLDDWPGESLIRFCNDGTEFECRRNMNVAPEQQPWILDDMPFAERRAAIEKYIAECEENKRLREIKKARLFVGQEVWMVSGPYRIKGTVVDMGPISMLVVEVLPWRDQKGGERRLFYYSGKQFDCNHHPEFGPWRLEE